jgi:hypothetical protein
MDSGGTVAQHIKRENEIRQTIARIRTNALAAVCALIGGLGLFAMTVWLLIKGGPHVGKNLQLLSNYFIGYTVTWSGSVVGLFYGALCGGAIGWAVGTTYNSIVNMRER